MAPSGAAETRARAAGGTGPTIRLTRAAEKQDEAGRLQAAEPAARSHPRCPSSLCTWVPARQLTRSIHVTEPSLPERNAQTGREDRNEEAVQDLAIRATSENQRQQAGVFRQLRGPDKPVQPENRLGWCPAHSQQSAGSFRFQHDHPQDGEVLPMRHRRGRDWPTTARPGGKPRMGMASRSLRRRDRSPCAPRGKRAD